MPPRGNGKSGGSRRREKPLPPPFHLGTVGGLPPGGLKQQQKNAEALGAAEKGTEGDAAPVGRAERYIHAARLLKENPSLVDEYLEESDGPVVPENWQRLYRDDASTYWDFFYKQKGTSFFMDRQWLYKDFPEVVESEVPAVVVELGCGPGANLFPLLRSNPHIYVFAYDFSPHVVAAVEANEEYDSKRCTVLQRDITKEDAFPEVVEAGRADYVFMLFVLSAISPERHRQALRETWKALKPGGLLFYRDYALHDMSQLRFGPSHRLEPNFYVRGDGTCVYYGSEDETRHAVESAGFDVVKTELLRKDYYNGKSDIPQPRCWVKGTFQKPLETAPAV